MSTITFDEVYSTYEKPIYNYLLRMADGKAQAEDLAQETFIKVFKHLPEFRGDSQVSTWIYRIATNTYRDHYRSAAHKRDGQTDQWDSEDALPDESEKILSIEDQLIQTEMNACIMEYLTDLSEDLRAVIILHDLRSFKNREIGEVLDISLEAVKIRLHRARKKFRSVLAKNCDLYYGAGNALGCDRKEN